MPWIGWEILGQALVPLLPQCVLRTCTKISHEREPSLCSSRLWNAKSLLPGPCGGTLRQRQVAWQAPGCGLGRAAHVQVTAWSSGPHHCHAYSSTASIRPRALSSHYHPLTLPTHSFYHPLPGLWVPEPLTFQSSLPCLKHHFCLPLMANHKYFSGMASPESSLSPPLSVLGTRLSSHIPRACPEPGHSCTSPPGLQ